MGTSGTPIDISAGGAAASAGAGAGADGCECLGARARDERLWAAVRLGPAERRGAAGRLGAAAGGVAPADSHDRLEGERSSSEPFKSKHPDWDRASGGPADRSTI